MIILLQCCKCKAILADTSAYVAAGPELGVVTVQDSLPGTVTVKEGILTSPPGDRDAGSQYRLLSCSGCSERVGKLYVAPVGISWPVVGYHTYDVAKLLLFKVEDKAQSVVQESTGVRELATRIQALERLVVHLYSMLAKQ